MDFTEVILVVLPENLPCCYRAREGSIRATTAMATGKMRMRRRADLRILERVRVKIMDLH